MEKKIQDIKPIYSWIVDSVIAKARAHFLQDGVDESVLEDLKLRWEAKLEASDVFNAEEGVVDNAGKEDTEGAKTPEDDSTGGENKGAGKGGEPQAKKRKIFPNDPKNVESPDAGTEGGSANGSPADAEKPKDGVDLDDDLDDDEPGEAEEGGNLVVAQYDKVVRNKNRWKCTMKHGIVHIDGREYVFSKATGEFVF